MNGGGAATCPFFLQVFPTPFSACSLAQEIESQTSQCCLAFCSSERAPCRGWGEREETKGGGVDCCSFFPSRKVTAPSKVTFQVLGPAPSSTPPTLTYLVHSSTMPLPWFPQPAHSIVNSAFSQFSLNYLFPVRIPWRPHYHYHVSLIVYFVSILQGKDHYPHLILRLRGRKLLAWDDLTSKQNLDSY